MIGSYFEMLFGVTILAGNFCCSAALTSHQAEASSESGGAELEEQFPR